MVIVMKSKQQPEQPRHKKGSLKGGRFAKSPVTGGADPKSPLGKTIQSAKDMTSARIRLYNRKKANKPQDVIEKAQAEYDSARAKYKKLNEKLKATTGQSVTASGKIQGEAKELPKPKPKQKEADDKPKTGLGSDKSLAQWGKIKTVEGMRDEALRKFGPMGLKNANFSGIDVRLVSIAMSTLEKLSVKYPEAMKNIKVITNLLPPPFTSANAAYDSSKGMLYLNRLRLGDKDEFEARKGQAMDVGFSQKGGNPMENTMTHEFGHVVDKTYRSQRDFHIEGKHFNPNNGLMFKLQKSAREEYLKAPDSDTLRISDYAKSSARELFAESFSALETGNMSSRHTRKVARMLFHLQGIKRKGDSEWDITKIPQADYDRILKDVESVK